MAHLTPEQLLDLAEGTLDEGSPGRQMLDGHLTSCAACRRDLLDVRETLALAAGDEAEEPSPLFWDHVSARISRAIEADRAQAPERWWTLFTARPWRVGVFVGAAAAVVLVVALTMRLGPAPANPTPVVAQEEAGLAPDFLEADTASLQLLAGLAWSLSWDDASEAGLMMDGGAVDDVIIDMTSDERLEVQRLLEEALARPSDKVQG